MPLGWSATILFSSAEGKDLTLLVLIVPFTPLVARVAYFSM